MKILCSDGITLEWSVPLEVGKSVLAFTPAQPIPINVSVTPHRPGHWVTLEYRVAGGPLLSLPAVPYPILPGVATRSFQAVLPAPLAGPVEYIPVLHLGDQTTSPSLTSSPSLASHLKLDSSCQASSDSLPLESNFATSPGPSWSWRSHFLGTLSARLRKEIVGRTPDGLRINWHVIEGSFVGPGLQATICPGATDWMRIREDGIAIVDVNASFLTSDGAMIYGSYGGIFDLGPDGYERALRNSFDPMPPVIVAPTYATAAQELQWLNRCQCVGLGRVDMRTRSVCFDVYRMEVGGPAM
jgi:hypothetical protein